MQTLECLVIGAGAVGLAIARQLSRRCQVMVLEQHASAGQETTSRNSGVIHAGLYYPQHFLKTRLCMQGREQLYRYCQQHEIPYKRCGKWIVASHRDELPALHALHNKAKALAIPCQLLSQAQIKESTPEINAIAALHSPDTGIIDSAAYIQQLERDVLNNGSQLFYQHTVGAIEKKDNGFLVSFSVNQQQHQVYCKRLINAAGLQAQTLSHTLAETTRIATPNSYYCKGQYFAYTGNERINQLIYPLPKPNHTGLGIHLTLNMDGSMKFGPDAHYTNNAQDYGVDEAQREHFAQAIQRYLPTIQADELQPDYAGIRPKLTAAHESAADFIIAGPESHGINNLIQCFGIESPGLTASLAIGHHVENLLWP